jgi:hypothetical protein
MKGVVTLLELLLVILILITSFAIFFPRFTYESKWEDALLFLKGRDVILTMDRNKTLYENSFNFSSLQNFLGKIFPKEPLVFLPGVEGTIKSKIQVACNCTDEEKKIISDWLNGPRGKAILRINERDIDFDVCMTHLEELNPCLSEYTDVLVIWGKKNLNHSKYLALLKGHLERGNGIIEVRDFSNSSETNDNVQQKIFGLSWVRNTTEPPSYDEFKKPENATEIIYGPWKYFYHIPVNLEAIYGEGNFTFRENTYKFWIQSSSSVCIDLNRNDECNPPDEIVNVGSNFQIEGYNFYLSYIRGTDAIGISFKPTYNFKDFLRVDGSAYEIQPGDGNKNRTLLIAKPQDLPVVILNVTPISRVAWIADFTESGVGDDERLLFISLLLWASNKREFWIREIASLPPEYPKVIYFASYINAINKDMFEVYEFKLGMGYPYK